MSWLEIPAGSRMGRDGGSGLCRGLLARLPTHMHHFEYHGNEQQRGDGRTDQAADDGAAQRRVLLGASSPLVPCR